MAVIFADGAALYDSNATAVTAKGYTTPGSSPSFRQAGAWGAGSYSIKWTGWLTAAAYIQPLPSAATYTLGFRWSLGAGGTIVNAGTGLAVGAQLGPIQFGLNNVNPSHLVIFNSTTSAVLRDMGVAPQTGVWHYLEMQVTISATVGAVTVWEDGVQTFAGTNLNTGSTNITQFSIGVSVGATATSGAGGTLSTTDVYVTDTSNASGAGNTGALGPVRVETGLPMGAGSTTTWTPLGTNACSANQFNPTATTGFVADTNCTLSNVGLPADVLPSPYGTDEVFSSALKATASGSPVIVTTLTGVSGFAVTPGLAYTAAALVDIAGTGGTCQVGIRWYTSGGGVIQTDFGGSSVLPVNTWTVLFANATAPATAAFAAVVIDETAAGNTFDVVGCTFLPTPTGFTGAIIKNPSLAAANWGNVSEPVADAGTYNRDAGATGIGDVDTYVMADLATTAGTPLAVIVTLIASKEVPNPRSVAPTIRVSGTNFFGTSTTLNNDLAYHAVRNVWELNPNGNVAWTISTVNATEAGIEISA